MGILDGLFNSIGSAVSSIPSILSDGFDSDDNILESVTEGISDFGSFVTDGLSNVSKLGDNVLKDTLGIAGNPISGSVGAITGILGGNINRVTGYANKIIGGVSSILGGDIAGGIAGLRQAVCAGFNLQMPSFKLDLKFNGLCGTDGKGKGPMLKVSGGVKSVTNNVNVFEKVLNSSGIKKGSSIGFDSSKIISTDLGKLIPGMKDYVKTKNTSISSSTGLSIGKSNDFLNSISVFNPSYKSSDVFGGLFSGSPTWLLQEESELLDIEFSNWNKNSFKETYSTIIKNMVIREINKGTGSTAPIEFRVYKIDPNGSDDISNINTSSPVYPDNIDLFVNTIEELNIFNENSEMRIIYDLQELEELLYQMCAIGLKMVTKFGTNELKRVKNEYDAMEELFYISRYKSFNQSEILKTPYGFQLGLKGIHNDSWNTQLKVEKVNEIFNNIEYLKSTCKQNASNSNNSITERVLWKELYKYFFNLNTILSDHKNYPSISIALYNGISLVKKDVSAVINKRFNVTDDNKATLQDLILKLELIKNTSKEILENYN
jgi:hypothetical protein